MRAGFGRARAMGAGLRGRRPNGPGGGIPPRWTPGPARPQGPEPMPWNARYETSVAQANRDYGLGQDQLNAEAGQIRQSYGFEDPTNPFSQAAVLQRTFEDTQRSTGNNYARNGQLYAGSFSNARHIDMTNFNQNYDQLRRSYQQALGENTARGVDLTNQRSDRIAEAEAKRFEDAIAQPVDPEEASPGYYMKDPNFYRKRALQLRKNRQQYRPRGYRIRRSQLLANYRRAVQERSQ